MIVVFRVGNVTVYNMYCVRIQFDVKQIHDDGGQWPFIALFGDVRKCYYDVRDCDCCGFWKNINRAVIVCTYLYRVYRLYTDGNCRQSSFIVTLSLYSFRYYFRNGFSSAPVERSSSKRNSQLGMCTRGNTTGGELTIFIYFFFFQWSLAHNKI